MYVDGFVIPVKKENLGAYRARAETVGRVWRDHGALEYREWIGDDVPPGKVTSFPRAVDLRPDEVVVFAWIVYESRAKRDEVNAKVLADPRMQHDPSEETFDGKRLVWGGFAPLVSL